MAATAPAGDQTTPGVRTSGGLSYQRCRWCRAAAFLPRSLCATCGSTDLAEERSAGLGRVYGSTVLRRRGHPPRHLSVIALDEGFQICAAVAGALPDTLAIGERVRLDANAAPGRPEPVFRLLPEEERIRG